MRQLLSKVALSAVLLALTLAAAAPARAWAGCRFGGAPNSFTVLRYSGSSYGEDISLGVRVKQTLGTTESGDDYFSAGVYVLNASTARLVAFSYVVATEADGYIRVTGQNDQIVEVGRSLAPVPGWYNAHLHIPGSVPPGEYLVAAFAAGGGKGVGVDPLRVSASAEWEGWFDAETMGHCPVQEVDGELVHFDEGDFVGTGVDVPGARVQSGRLSLRNERSYLVGSLLHYTYPWRTVSHDLTYSRLLLDTPTGDGELVYDVAPLSSTAGEYMFQLRQRGLFPSADLTFLAFTLTEDPLG